MGGRRQGSDLLLPEGKHAVAVHRAGRALAAALSPRADPVAKVTNLSAGQALGVTEQLPLAETPLYGEEHHTQTLAVRLDGPTAKLVEVPALRQAGSVIGVPRSRAMGRIALPATRPIM